MNDHSSVLVDLVFAVLVAVLVLQLVDDIKTYVQRARHLRTLGSRDWWKP